MCGGTIMKLIDPIGTTVLGAVGVDLDGKKKKGGDSSGGADEAVKKPAIDETGAASATKPVGGSGVDTGRISPDIGLQIPPGQ